MRDLIAEKNIELETLDPVTRFGFTQVPNFILTNATLGIGAKMTYAMFLHYAWYKDSCFPGQDRLAVDMGMSTSRVNEFIKELETAGFVEIIRRGQGRTNVYKIKFVVKQKRKQRDS
jgi:DNA-binding MarR family transcriptional regulator